MNPAENILSALPAKSAMRDTLSYYVNCVGKNPFTDKIDIASILSNNFTTQLISWNATASSLSQFTCVNDLSAVSAASNGIITDGVNALIAVIDCTGINNVWNEVCQSIYYCR
jgi:hypothetical protein